MPDPAGLLVRTGTAAEAGTGVAAGAGAAPLSASPAIAASERNLRYLSRVLQGMLILVVLGQRLVVPIGALSLSFPLLVAFIGLLLARLRGGIRRERLRTELYLASATAVMLSAWLTSWRGGDISLTSLLLLLVLYLPWAFTVPPAFAGLLAPVLRCFVRLMVLCAAIGAGQMMLQLAHAWAYVDYLLKWVPAQFVSQGYNTSYPISYLSPVIKANAFVFLEPSFLCQFCALALIVSLVLRAPAWQPLVLGLGMAATLSGTGILLLVAGVGLLVVRVPNRIRPSYVMAGVIGLIVVFSTPAANILIDRRDETSQQGSSGYNRFVQPYVEVSSGLAEQPSRYVIGAGSGSSDRLLTSDRFGGEAVVYTILPKMAFEYGLITAMVLVGFLLVSILRGPGVPVLPATTAFMIFFLSGSLLQPHTIITAWLLTSLWGSGAAPGSQGRLPTSGRREVRRR